VESEKPDWFRLIKAWVAIGGSGLTLPFLVGATSYHRGKSAVDHEDIRSLLDEIIEYPVEGCIVYVRWCVNLESAVFAVYEQDSLYKLYGHRGVEIRSQNSSAPSLIIDRYLAKELEPRLDRECLLKALIEEAEEPVSSRNFSRNRIKDGVQDEPFQRHNLEFIQKALRNGK